MRASHTEMPLAKPRHYGAGGQDCSHTKEASTSLSAFSLLRSHPRSAGSLTLAVTNLMNWTSPEIFDAYYLEGVADERANFLLRRPSRCLPTHFRAFHDRGEIWLRRYSFVAFALA